MILHYLNHESKSPVARTIQKRLTWQLQEIILAQEFFTNTWFLELNNFCSQGSRGYNVENDDVRWKKEADDDDSGMNGV